MHKRRLLLPLLATLAALAPRVHAWTDCSSGAAAFSVKDVTLEPSPVKPGDTAKFSIIADSAKDVADGSVQMIVRYSGLPIWTQMDNLCDKTECPVKRGPVEVRYSQLFPIITPPGAYTLVLVGQSNGDALFCVSVDFQVVPPEGAAAVGGLAAGIKGGLGQQLLRTHRRSLQK